jgi:hypothetical protein
LTASFTSGRASQQMEDVSADAVFEAVEDGAQRQGGLQVIAGRLVSRARCSAMRANSAWMRVIVSSRCWRCLWW